MRSRRAFDLSVAAAAALAGAGLVWVAGPCLVASLIEAPSKRALTRLHDAAVDVAALRRVVESREASLRWHERGRTWTDLALARLLTTGHGGAEEREAGLMRAEQALVRGLALSPMHPYGWMRIVEVRMARGRPAAEIAPAFGLALDTGPREDRMLPILVQAGLHVWGGLDRGHRDQVADKVRLAWRKDPVGTAAIAQRAGQVSLLARLVGLRSAEPREPHPGVH